MGNDGETTGIRKGIESNRSIRRAVPTSRTLESGKELKEYIHSYFFLLFYRLSGIRKGIERFLVFPFCRGECGASGIRKGIERLFYAGGKNRGAHVWNPERN